MDVALRTLREGRIDGGPAPLLALCDEVAVVGGAALLRKAVTELAAAIAGGRAQATRLTVVALQHPAALYQRLCGPTSVPLTVLDCFADPYGWGSILGAGSSSGSSSQSNSITAHVSSSNVVLLSGILAAANGLQQLEQQLASAAATAGFSGVQQCSLIIDSLSPLLRRFGAAAVTQLLHRLQVAGASCLLCGLHSDLHTASDVAAIEQLAAGTLQLQTVSELERSVCSAAQGQQPQGRLAVRLKRRAGRVKAATQLYCVDGSGAVAFMDLPADVLNPRVAAEQAVAAAAGNGGSHAGGAASALAQQLAGGMKMTLSAAEQEARQRVQLPFEHQGQGSAYQTGDFRDYLPPEAGGRAGARWPKPSSATGAAAAGAEGVALGPATAAGGVQGQQGQQDQGLAGQGGSGIGSGRLGHILYVRDSGSEHDSDEDPDDDLDI